MAMFLSNLRSAWRQLTRSPGVSLVAVLSLALGIGANTTVFTLVNALLSPDADAGHSRGW